MVCTDYFMSPRVALRPGTSCNCLLFEGIPCRNKRQGGNLLNDRDRQLFTSRLNRRICGLTRRGFLRTTAWHNHQCLQCLHSHGVSVRCTAFCTTHARFPSIVLANSRDHRANMVYVDVSSRDIAVA